MYDWFNLIDAAKTLNTTPLDLMNWPIEWIQRAMVYENSKVLIEKEVRANPEAYK